VKAQWPFLNALSSHALSGVFVPLQSDFVVEEIEPANPLTNRFALNNIAHIATAPADGSCEGRGHIPRPGEDLFLEDETGGLHVPASNRTFRSRKVVEPVGFPDSTIFFPCWKTHVSADEGSSRAGQAGDVTVADMQAGCTRRSRHVTGQSNDRSFPRRSPRGDGTQWTGQC